MSWTRHFLHIPLSCLQRASWLDAQKRPQLLGSLCAGYIGWLEAKEQNNSLLVRVAKGWIGMGIGAYAEGMTRFCLETRAWKWFPSTSVASLMARSIVSGFVPTLGCAASTEVMRLAFKAIFRGAPLTKKTDQWANLISYTFTTGALINAGGKAAEIWAKGSGDLGFLGAWAVGTLAVTGVSLFALKQIVRKTRPEIDLVEQEIQRIPLLMECAHA